MSPGAPTAALFGGIFAILIAASLLGFVLRRRYAAESAAATIENFNARVRAWWIMVALLGFAFALGKTGVILLFAFASFAGLREFLTLTSTRRGDHWALAAAFFVVLPFQYYLVWIEWYGLYSIFIPVYVFLILPVIAALRGDATRFMERIAELQWGLMIAVFWADQWSSQHLDEGVAMGTRKRRSDWAGRGVLRSPGRPGVARREDRRRFWAAIAAGLASEDAACRVGVSPAVGTRSFREAGGMPPAALAPSSKPLCGRYLSFAEREEIALCRVQGQGLREVARRLGRAASTISRELRRNAATRGGGLDYRATAVVAGRRAAAALSQQSRGPTRRCGHMCRTGWPASSPPGAGLHPRAGRGLEGPPARASEEPAVGQGVEPGADRPAVTVRLSRR